MCSQTSINQSTDNSKQIWFGVRRASLMHSALPGLNWSLPRCTASHLTRSTQSSTRHSCHPCRKNSKAQLPAILTHCERETWGCKEKQKLPKARKTHPAQEIQGRPSLWHLNWASTSRVSRHSSWEMEEGQFEAKEMPSAQAWRREG